MPSRLGALRVAALLAVGFVALRVAYRVIFGGAGGGGIVLLDLERIRLGGPFEHITLLGPITTGGLASAAASALPFAAVVLGFGVLSAIIDLRALLTRGSVRGPVRTFSRALVVALATFPALLASVNRVRVARQLRGERGAASLVVPVLEQTVERAIALGASMEVRGFAAVAPTQPTCERPAELRDVSLGYDGRWCLEHITLDLAPGTLTVITGATGSGKSTLLHAMSGLFQHVSAGEQLGSIHVAGVDRRAVPPRETARFVGVVSQAVRLSFVAPTVADELGFAMATRGVAPVIVRDRAEEVAGRLGIRHLLDRRIDALSAGEACLVAIGAAITERPVLLLVDEPLAELDAAARARVVALLAELAHDARVCVVVAEHSTAEWGELPDSWVALEDGTVSTSRPDRREQPPTRHVRPGAPVAEIRDLSVRHGDAVAVDRASLTLRAGEVVAVRGPNGAGKSSLLHAIALPAATGTVIVGGRDVHSLGRRDRRNAVTLVPEAADDLLFAVTVADECRRADRRTTGAPTVELLLRLLGVDIGDADALLAQHPRDLSAGQRLCLVLAIQLSARPSVLLVDEPSRGLDDRARALVGRALAEAAAAGAAVLIATHDTEFADRYCSRTTTMTAGRLTAEVSA